MKRAYYPETAKAYKASHPEYRKYLNKKRNERLMKRYHEDLEYRKKLQDKANERVSSLRRKRRQQVIEAYGGRCEVCGIAELRFLTLDHSLQDGAEHRKKVGDCGKVYADIVRRGFPKDEGYRVLCWNHNCGGA